MTTNEGFLLLLMRLKAGEKPQRLRFKKVSIQDEASKPDARRHALKLRKICILDAPSVIDDH